jgi:DNA-binding LytR/AlgR family response regulator
VTSVRPISPSGLRVILCMKFSHQSSFKDLADFKHALISKEQVLHSVEVSGSFDFMIESEHPNLADYQEMVDGLAAHSGHLMEHYEASFICRRYLREGERDTRHLWVPADSGIQRLEHDQVDKVSAEGDYVRVHSGAASWLLHVTMGKIFEELGSDRFLQLSRSLIVRADSIARLVHESRRWTALLHDGSKHPIAKSRSSGIVAQLKADSSVGKADSPISALQDEISTKVAEKAV